MKYNDLTFFQVFNAMRQYLTSYLDMQQNGDISILLSSLKLDTSIKNWKKDLSTWDQAAFEDWMNGVEKTLKDLSIKDDPKNIKYNEWAAFLCMKNYLQIFYEEIPFRDVAMLIEKINTIKQGVHSKEWGHWLSCINYVVENEDKIHG